MRRRAGAARRPWTGSRRNQAAFCAGYAAAGGADPGTHADPAARPHPGQGGLRSDVRGEEPAVLAADPARLDRRRSGMTRPRRPDRSAPVPRPTCSPSEIDRIVAGLHHDPHAVLGAHPGPDGVDRPGAAAAGPAVDRGAPDGRRFPLTTCTRAYSRARCRWPRCPTTGSRSAYPGPNRHHGAGADDRHPVPVPAHARRDRPAPDRRGQARGAVAGARRPRARIRLRRHRVRQGHRDRVRRLGAERAGRRGSSATSTTGTAAATRCARSAARGSGSCSCPASATAPTTSSTSAGPDGQWRRKADPMASLRRASARHRVGRVHLRLRPGATRTGWPRAAEAERTASR